MKKRGFIGLLLLGPQFPSVEDYLAALTKAPLKPRTDIDKVVFDASELRLHNSEVSVVYYKSEVAETVDMAMYGQAGGLVITVVDGEILTITKDGMTTQSPRLDNSEKYKLFQMIKVIRREAAKRTT